MSDFRTFNSFVFLLQYCPICPNTRLEYGSFFNLLSWCTVICDFDIIYYLAKSCSPQFFFFFFLMLLTATVDLLFSLALLYIARIYIIRTFFSWIIFCMWHFFSCGLEASFLFSCSHHVPPCNRRLPFNRDAIVEPKLSFLFCRPRMPASSSRLAGCATIYLLRQMANRVSNVRLYSLSERIYTTIEREGLMTKKK